MRTILTVTTAGTAADYDDVARAEAGIVLADLNLTLEGYDQFAFSEFACGPIPLFVEGSPFSLSVVVDDSGDGGGGGGDVGGGPAYYPPSFFAPTFFAPTYFAGGLGGGGGGPDLTVPRVLISGQIVAIEATQGGTGWVFLYRCAGLKRLGDYVPVQAQDGTGDADYNLQPDDPDYDQSRAGQSVGGIIQKLLEVEATATALHALGIGGYAESSPGVLLIPVALNPTTVADLTFMTVVPPTPVHLRGEGIFRTLEQLILNWHPQYACWIRPDDGVIRFQDLFTFPIHNLTVPGPAPGFDPVEWPRFTIDSDQCYTQVRVVGIDIQPAFVQTSQKTLVPAWTPAEQAAWNIDQFLTPTESSDEGAILSCTSNSCVVRSDHPNVHWILNFWNARQGQISLLDTLATGVEVFQFRDITSCTAMSPGGTATITWDASLPITATSYDRYTLLCTSAPLSRVWREYWIADPSTCTTSGGFTTCTSVGTATWVGSHMEHRFPNGVNWANNGKVIRIYSPSGLVTWSQNGKYPTIAFPMNFKLETATGKIIFNQPVVVPFGDPGALKRGSPATFVQGLPVDVQAVIPYNRGDMFVQAPLAGTGVDGGDYSGTAKSRAGIERILTLYRPEWNYRGNTAAYQAMAEQHLITTRDVSVEGAIDYHFDAALPSFDMFAMGYALNLAIAGTPGVLDSMYLPVRSMSLQWPNDGPDINRVTINFSNRRRPFEGDDLYVHPQWSTDTFGMEKGMTMIAGNIRGDWGFVQTENLYGDQVASGGKGGRGGGGTNGSLGGGGGAGGGGGKDAGEWQNLLGLAGQYGGGVAGMGGAQQADLRPGPASQPTFNDPLGQAIANQPTTFNDPLGNAIAAGGGGMGSPGSGMKQTPADTARQKREDDARTHKQELDANRQRDTERARKKGEDRDAGAAERARRRMERQKPVTPPPPPPGPAIDPDKPKTLRELRND